jgi:hypothetical protein
MKHIHVYFIKKGTFLRETMWTSCKRAIFWHYIDLSLVIYTQFLKFNSTFL